MRNDTFLRALLRQPTAVHADLDHAPGRPLSARILRHARNAPAASSHLCKTPELACEVTLQPLARYALDAAILFSDILTVPDAMGLGLYFAEGEGPQFERPVRDEGDSRALAVPDLDDSSRYVIDAVRDDPPRARRPRAADRLFRQPLHARLLHGRGRRQRRLPPREDA